MLSRVRKFLKNNSPDWLNTEVNKDLLQNLTTSLSQGSNEYPNKSQITDTSISSGYFTSLEQVKPSPIKSNPREVKRSQTKSNITTNPPLMTDDCSLMTVKGTPHWRRIRQVFQTLDNAPENSTYNQLIEYVRQSTGKGCSRKLISKWKKQKLSHKLPSTTDEIKSNGLEETADILNNNLAIAHNQNQICQSQTISNTLSTVNSLQLNDRNSLMTVKAWSYLAAAGITIALVGCELLPLNNDRPNEKLPLASATAPITPLPPRPERRNRLEPRNLKIELTLSSPQDLKVKPGDKISAGQTLSDRLSERNRLQAKKKQLQLSLEKLNLPLTPIPKPKPIPEIAKLPPVSYAEEEAAIKFKQQKLAEANRAIALQQKKIDSLNQLITKKTPSNMASPLSRGGSALGGSPDLKQLPWTEGEQKKGSPPNLKLILEHEQANLKNLEAARQSAQIQLEVAQSQLTTAKERRAYIEYQRQLEQTRRALAIEQQQQAIASQESDRSRLLAEREYSQAQIETQIQTLDYQIHQLSTVTAPYEGTIKKVKWTGQSDHNLTAVITLAVDSVTSQQSTVTSNTEPINSQE